AHAGVAGHEDRERLRIADALAPEPLEHGELALAPHVRRRLSEERAHALGGFTLSEQRVRSRLTADLEALLEQPRGHVIEEDGPYAALSGADRLGGRFAQELDRSIDRLPDQEP